MGMGRKLSPRMEQAMNNLSEHGRFALKEYPDWSFWKPMTANGPQIRTDTMKALDRRGLVKINSEVNGRRRIWYADLDRSVGGKQND